MLDDRLRRLFRNIFGSAAARFINLLIALALVPLTINSLTPTDYAFLSIAISLSALSSYADLGIGLAIVNTLARESNAKTPRRSQRAISVVWFTLLIVAFGALAITGGAALLVDHLVTSESLPRYNAILLGVACIFFGLPSGLIQRILFARHRTTEANIWATCGRVLSLFFVWIAVKVGATNLPTLVFGVIGIPVLVSWLSVFVVFRRAEMQALMPRIKLFDKRILKPYLITGLSFLAIQLVPYVEVGMDTILAGTLISISIVPALDVHTRLFTYVPALASIALFPLWPAIANAKAAGDIAWILKIRRWAYLLVCAIAMTLSGLLLLNVKQIIIWWTKQALNLPTSVVTGMAVFAVLTCLGSVQSMFLNGAGIIKKQVYLYLPYILILLSIKSISAISFGLTGMVWSLNICFIARLYFAEKLLRQAFERPPSNK